MVIPKDINEIHMAYYLMKKIFVMVVELALIARFSV
jgi:hypothetical protein